MRDTVLAASPIAIAAALLAPPTAAAAQAPPSSPAIETVGEWELRVFRPDSCAAARRFADGTQLHLFGFEGGYSILTIFHPSWPVTGRPTYRMVLVRGGERRALEAEDVQRVGRSGLDMPLSEARLAEVAAAEAVEVLGPDGAVLKRVEPAGLAAVAASMPACLRRAAAQAWPAVSPPPPPPAPRRPGKVRRASPRSPLHLLISADDYPIAAREANEEGRVGYRLEIDREGRVTGCTILSSSGSSVLDAATCRLLTSRARFEPARDRKGRRVADSAMGRVVWALEDLPPETPPPPQ